MKITEVTDISTLTPMKSEWNELLHKNATNSVFLTFDYVVEWYRHFCGTENTLILLVQAEDGRLVGIAPFFIEEERLFFLSRRVLKLAGSNSVCAEYLDIIADSNSQDEVLKAVFEYIYKNEARWDIIFLTDLMQGSNILKNKSLLLNKYPDTLDVENRVCLYRTLPSTWEAMQQSLKKKFVKKIEYYERRIRREADCEFGIYEDIEEGMGELYGLHQERWQKRGIFGAFSGEKTKKFNIAVAKSFAQNGNLKLYYLKCNNKTAAVLYCFLYKSILYYYNGGFDISLEKYNVGTVLLKNCMHDAIQLGCSEFDFLRGQSNYKSDWGTESRAQRALILELKRMNNTLFRAVKLGPDAIARVLARLLPVKIRKTISRYVNKKMTQARLDE